MCYYGRMLCGSSVASRQRYPVGSEGDGSRSTSGAGVKVVSSQYTDVSYGDFSTYTGSF